MLMRLMRLKDLLQEAIPPLSLDIQPQLLRNNFVLIKYLQRNVLTGSIYVLVGQGSSRGRGVDHAFEYTIALCALVPVYLVNTLCYKSRSLETQERLARWRARQYKCAGTRINAESFEDAVCSCMSTVLAK